MSERSVRGRTFWDFCAERPVVLVLAIFLIGSLLMGLAMMFMADGIHFRFQIGPQASELANHDQ